MSRHDADGQENEPDRSHRARRTNNLHGPPFLGSLEPPEWRYLSPAVYDKSIDARQSARNRSVRYIIVLPLGERAARFCEKPSRGGQPHTPRIRATESKSDQIETPGGGIYRRSRVGTRWALQGTEMKHRLITAVILLIALTLYAISLSHLGLAAFVAAAAFEGWFWIRLVSRRERPSDPMAPSV